MTIRGLNKKITIAVTGILALYAKQAGLVDKEILQPNRFKEAGFPARKIGYFPLQTQPTEIRKNIPKTSPFRPV